MRGYMKTIRYDVDTKPLNGLMEEITIRLPYYDADNNLKHINRTVVLKAEVITHSPETARLIKMYEALRQKVWGAPDDYLTAHRELGCQGDSGRRFYGISGYDSESLNLVLFDYGWQGGAFNTTEKNCCLPYYYSHFLAVDHEVPETINGESVLLNYRSCGLGVKAKLFIDKIVKKEGLFANIWTVNPLLGGNAGMNFSHYGAGVLLFDPNHYGPMTGLNIGLRTDRFVMIKPYNFQLGEINPDIKEKIIKAVRQSSDKTDPQKNGINRIILNQPESVPGSIQKKEIERCREILKNIDADLEPENPRNNHLVKRICALPLDREDDYLILQIPEDFDKDYRLNPALTRENQLLLAILLNRYVKEFNYGVRFLSVRSSKGKRFNFYILEKGKGLCRFRNLPWRPPETAAFIKTRLKLMGIDS